MALANYSNLIASIKSWTKRKDLDNDLLQDFVTLAEDFMYNNTVSPLRVSELETRSNLTASTSSRFLALPTGFLEFRRLDLTNTNGDTFELKVRAPAQLSIYDNDTGIPEYYAIVDQIEFDIKPDSAYTLPAKYYAKQTGLSSSNATNAVLTAYPRIYLNACLAEAYDWAREEDIAQVYRNKALDAIKGANGNSKMRLSPAPQARREGYLP